MDHIKLLFNYASFIDNQEKEIKSAAKELKKLFDWLVSETNSLSENAEKESNVNGAIVDLKNFVQALDLKSMKKVNDVPIMDIFEDKSERSQRKSKYNKRGYCMFQNKCKFIHTDII